ncbi:FAD-dependent oxidoreductase [Salinimicrobium sp. GXAS 041]|uniref:FAD-dependent oxidoreductase n=1 Tax=Salinimicrobium sp. GXAS 041 TaxID=3400806 RepID=UPI003C724D3D
MFTQSLWNSFSGSTNFPVLKEDLEVDVAIIGGGITGISTAHLLSEAGYSVAVIEERKVGGGTTSHSTGNLYFTIDQTLSSLQSKYNNEIIRKVAASRHSAIELIEDNIKRYNIDCDFQRVPWYLYAANEENTEKINKEFETAKEAGVRMDLAGDKEIPFPMTRGVKVDEQAQFNSMRYVQGLANAIVSPSCQIFENTRVTEIHERDELVTLLTTAGTVKAKYAVHATHSPKGKKIEFHTVLGPYREYGVAVKLKSGSYPKGTFWGYYDAGSKYSVRSYKRGEDQFLIAVGQPHKVGQAKDNVEHIENLVVFLRKYFDVGEITHRWGGQHYKPADKLPYIGPESDNSRIYIATGFATDGLTYGPLAAMIIKDHISEKPNPYYEVYKASRFSPGKSAKEFIKENVNVAVQLLKDLPFSGNEEELTLLKPEEGRIIEKDGHKMAISKSKNGKLNMHSAFCTHLGCVVHWNSAEKTWDCPCHGSRFDQKGDVLEGPAIEPLKSYNSSD